MHCPELYAERTRILIARTGFKIENRNGCFCNERKEAVPFVFKEENMKIKYTGRDLPICSEAQGERRF
jgi:hypothetical protein